MPERNAERTRARILRGALREFSKKGFDGARIDDIARSARVSARMLYHYFGDKKGLYRAVLLDRLSARTTDVNEQLSDDSAALPRQHYDAMRHDMHLARLMQWEALSAASASTKLVDEEARRTRYADLTAEFGRRQKTGSLTSALPPDLILLLIIAVTVYPICFPQVCRLITGETPGSEAFDDRFDRILDTVGQWLTETGSPPPVP